MMPDLSFLHASLFYELTALLVLAAAIGLVGQLLRQPLIVSFIVCGILAGPSALGIVQSPENIDLLAELGVAVLLFLIGLKLDLKLIRGSGSVALAAGLGQVLVTTLIGYALAGMFGLGVVTSFYVAVALTFSSTIIIVKLLSDKREVDALHGRIAIGILIVQDLVVVLAMILLSAAGSGSEAQAAAGPFVRIVVVLGYGVLMLGAIAVFVRFVATPLIDRVARAPDLLITFAIAWAALLAALGSHFGFSKELGGLLAGVALASTPYRESILARLSPLRDFLLLFFFVALGAQIDLGLLGGQLPAALALSGFVLLGKPVLVMCILGYMGYRKRTSFLAGLALGQISEFSLILMALVAALGRASAETVGLVTLVGLVTIALSVYMITYSYGLYRWLEPVLSIFERGVPYREQQLQVCDDGTAYDAILFGLGRYGTAIAKLLREEQIRILAIDFNPDEVRRWTQSGFHTLYGDACDQEFIAGLPLEGVHWVIAALPQHELGLTHKDAREVLIEALKARQYAGKIAVATQHLHDVEHLKAKGADIVLLPFHDAAERAVERIAGS
jgi:Kef-type K+ transport system membrane component KefB